MSAAASTPDRRWLGLAFPWFATESHRARDASAPDADAPFALIASQRGALRLVAVDRAAATLGLRAGLTLADARARIPQLVAAEHDALGQQRWLEGLAEACLRYTPLVAVAGDDALLLDVTGATHLHGGEAVLVADCSARLARAGVGARHAYASTADAALALARWGDADVDEAAAVTALPVAALELDPAATTALTRAGLKTVGALARRKPAAIAARFGAGAVAALDRLMGRASRPIVPVAPTGDIVVERRFAEPVARVEMMVAMLAELAAEACLRLGEAGQGGRAFLATLFRSDGAVRRLAIETGRATRDPAVIMRLVDERIAALSDPIDPGFGFDMLRLMVTAAEPLGAAQLKLEGGAVAEAELAALVDRLSTRLGRGRVLRLHPVDTHIPEQAQLSLPAVEAPAPARWPDAQLPPRPLHLFDPPQPIEVMAEVPDGAPLRFRWRRGSHEVRLYEGPERIAAEWWTRDDNAGLTRDYYRVEDARGRRFWLFRHGLYGRERVNPRWFVHGLFA